MTSKPKQHIIDTDKEPFFTEDWKVEEHKGMGKIEWDVNKFSLHLEPEQERECLTGNVLQERLKDKPVLNANVLDYLLAHKELIPEEWKGKYIFFWGTVYRDSDDDLWVRCLRWGGGRWHWYYYCLDVDWDADYPAVVASSVKPLESLTLDGEII